MGSVAEVFLDPLWAPVVDLKKTTETTANFFPAGKRKAQPEVKMTNTRGSFISTIQSSYINWAKGRFRATFISAETRPVQLTDLPIKLLLFLRITYVTTDGETFQIPANSLHYLVHKLLPYFSSLLFLDKHFADLCIFTVLTSDEQQSLETTWTHTQDQHWKLSVAFWAIKCIFSAPSADSSKVPGNGSTSLSEIQGKISFPC